MGASRFTVSKTFRFPAGHRLSKHLGDCKFLHGHNYKIVIYATTDHLNKNDMVIDFSLLKEIVKRVIDDWDHATMLNVSDIISPHMSKMGCCKNDPIMFNADPTAEVMAHYLFNRLNNILPTIEDVTNDVLITRVDVWETDDSCATYQEIYY